MPAANSLETESSLRLAHYHAQQPRRELNGTLAEASTLE
jgi:hypothetical protein